MEMRGQHCVEQEKKINIVYNFVYDKKWKKIDDIGVSDKESQRRKIYYKDQWCPSNGKEVFIR